ncbi:MAG: hypothetical protein HQK56_10065 [Deltaproteobacteria bacterium]|nr:hypothetical protein [Deltaproteobacteria bacterium]
MSKKNGFNRDDETENRLNAMTKDQLEQGILKQLDYLQGLSHVLHLAVGSEDIDMDRDDIVFDDLEFRLDETLGMYARYMSGDWSQAAVPASVA